MSVTRRLVATIVATVLGTLLVAGTTTVLLARWQARQSTEDVLREQAESLAGTLGTGRIDAGGPAQQVATRRLLRDLRQALRVDGTEFVRVDETGEIIGNLPEGLTVEDLDVEVLDDGVTVSGANGSLVYAAAPRVGPRATSVAVVTRIASTGLATATRWFLVAAATTLAIGVLVAMLLARRLARPVDAAALAARRIAGGELSTRLPAPDAGAHDELAELTRSINAMATNLERSKVLEQQFLLSVTHDLRTPLTSIKGYAEAISDGATDDPATAAGVILEESVRLERLVTDVLDLARLDGRSFSSHPVVHDLRVPIAEAARAFQPVAARLGLALEVDDTASALVDADPDRIGQILANLLTNASKFARSHIVVGLTTSAGWAILRVDDDGPGIAPDDLPHIFERLYVARHRPVRAEVGSGLGLAIVRQLAEVMGGSVGAGAAPGGGARIEVRLPVVEAEPVTPAGRVSASREPPAPTGDQTSGRSPRGGSTHR